MNIFHLCRTEEGKGGVLYIIDAGTGVLDGAMGDAR
jgi:hypothetical protein